MAKNTTASSYFGVKRIGEVKDIFKSIRPQSSDQLFFVFEDTGVDAMTVRAVFEDNFQASCLAAYRVVTQEYERPVVIQVLYDDRNERQKVLKSQNDGLILSRRDKSPIHASVHTAFPKKPTLRVYTVNGWMFSSIKDMKKDVREAVIRRLADVAKATAPLKGKEKAKKVMNASVSDVLEVDQRSIGEAAVNNIESTSEVTTDLESYSKDLDNCIEDILVPTGSSIYNDGSVTIILNKSRTLYSRLLKPIGHYLSSNNQKYRLTAPSKHYLYCQKCQSLDLHCTEECPML